jgi:hypothetical protein
MTAPNLTFTAEPNESGKIVFLALAPKTKNHAANGQLALKLRITNGEASKITLKDLTVSFVGQPAVASTTIPIQVATKDAQDNVVWVPLAINAGASASWFFSHTNNIILPVPAPGTISLRITAEGFSDPVKLEMPLAAHKSPTVFGSFRFPARVSDLRAREYWSGRSTTHASAGDGGQLFAYDMGVMTWDAAGNKWTGILPGTSGDKNEDYRIWGKPVVAMADGTVVSFKNDMAENTKMGKQEPTPNPVEGNHFYLQHGDELVVYAHLQKGSLNTKLMQKGAAVKQGDFLGLAGNSGNSTNPHLHIHSIQATQPWGGPPRPLPFQDIHVIDRTALAPPDPAGPWVKAEDQGLPNVASAIWPSPLTPSWYPPGWAELARHGIPEASYQTEFDRIVSSGYRLVWIDGYDVNGKTFFNVIFRPANGVAWQARHGLSGTQYQTEFDTWTGKGYRLAHIESYLSGGNVRYAPIFVKSSGPAYTAFHGRTAAEHQKLFDDLTRDGWRPVNITAVSPGGTRVYAGLYEKRDVGSFWTKTFMTPSEYQTEFDNNSKAGRKLVYLNAYTHQDGPRIIAIWHEKTAPAVARHGLSSSAYQQEFEARLGEGLLTRAVTGYEQADAARFAAFWTK